MVQVIEEEQDAGGAECINFSVYRSPTTPDRVLANWQHAEMEPFHPKGAIAIASSLLGTPVEIEFQRAVTYAHEHGIPFVWVNDPDVLFSPSERPSFEITPSAAIVGHQP